jgi:hypothetical protein
MQEQSGSGPQTAAEVLPVNAAATARAAPAVHRGAWRRFLIEFLLGFSGLVLALLAGEQVRTWLHLPVPGNVLGLFFLLLSFRLRLLPPQLIEKAAKQVSTFCPPSSFQSTFRPSVGATLVTDELDSFTHATGLVLPWVLHLM